MSNIVNNLLDKLGQIKKKVTAEPETDEKKRLQKFLQLKITARK